MAVVLRLSRAGTHKAPFYHVVATDSRKPRDGRYLEDVGQYDPTKLVNLGSNRWTFKPELGYSRRWGHWLFDAYASVWFFTQCSRVSSNTSGSPSFQKKWWPPISIQHFSGSLGTISG